MRIMVIAGGLRSNVLRHVGLTVNDTLCALNSTKLCTFTVRKDLCTYDSGGPIYLSQNERLFNVGVISEGFACASNRPGINTRITAYLDWILARTRATIYCVRWSSSFAYSNYYESFLVNVEKMKISLFVLILCVIEFIVQWLKLNWSWNKKNELNWFFSTMRQSLIKLN